MNGIGMDRATASEKARKVIHGKQSRNPAGSAPSDVPRCFDQLFTAERLPQNFPRDEQAPRVEHIYAGQRSLVAL